MSLQLRSIETQNHEANPVAGLPHTWSDSVKETHLQIENEHPNMDAASASALYEACNLLAVADHMEKRERGWPYDFLLLRANGPQWTALRDPPHPGPCNHRPQSFGVAPVARPALPEGERLLQ